MRNHFLSFPRNFYSFSISFLNVFFQRKPDPTAAAAALAVKVPNDFERKYFFSINSRQKEQ
jgi:hypothetical protein